MSFCEYNWCISLSRNSEIQLLLSSIVLLRIEKMWMNISQLNLVDFIPIQIYMWVSEVSILYKISLTPAHPHYCEKFRIYSENIGAFVLIENVNLSNVSLNSAESLIEMRTLPWSRDGNLIRSRYMLKLEQFFRTSQIQIKDEEWLGIDDWY